MISEAWQEDATLYALGLLDADEAAAFETELAANPELLTLVRELRDTAAALALVSDEPFNLPPADLRSQVLSWIAAESGPGEDHAETRQTATGATDEAKIVRPSFAWVPWSIAALLLGCSVWLAWSRQSLINESAERGRVTGLPPAVDVLSQVAFCELEAAPDPSVKPRAAVLWDAVKHRGILRLRQFTPATSGKDYQLWAVEAARKEPVNAGVIHVDVDGHADTTFEPDLIPGDNKVVALAISLEQAGGSPTNQGPILFVGKL